MKVMRFIVTLLTIFVVGASVGCGKSEKQEAEDLAIEGKAKASAASQNYVDLYKTHSIDLLNYRTVSWSGYSQTELRLIETKLVNQVAFVNRVVEIRNHKNIDGYITQDFRSTGTNASRYLTDLRAYKLTIGMR